MVIPHLMFAHMLGDYVLQTNWLVTRKNKSWDGLLLHGGVIGFLSLVTLAPYLSVVWLPLMVLTVLHTIQDYLKVYSGPRLAVHSFIPYMGDQVLHYLTIGGVSVWIGGRVSPSDAEIAYMWTGAAVITVTRFYDVTWWANWLDMIPYMNRWRWIGYTERLAILTLTAAGLWFFAPLCALPRLVLACYRRQSIWQQRRGLLELILGVGLSIALGLGLRTVYSQL